MVTQGQFSVGDRVRLTIGTRAVRGVVVDNRGPIGANKVHIYRVRVPNDPYDDDFLEMPEDELSPSEATSESIPLPSAVEYLKHGGLVQILRSSMDGGKNQPRVWLTRDSLGNVVHTFVAERGILGGATVPFFALHDNRVFGPKRDEVLEYLATFGLSSEDARSIIDVIGTTP